MQEESGVVRCDATTTTTNDQRRREIVEWNSVVLTLPYFCTEANTSDPELGSTLSIDIDIVGMVVDGKEVGDALSLARTNDSTIL